MRPMRLVPCCSCGCALKWWWWLSVSRMLLAMSRKRKDRKETYLARDAMRFELPCHRPFPIPRSPVCFCRPSHLGLLGAKRVVVVLAVNTLCKFKTVSKVYNI